MDDERVLAHLAQRFAVSTENIATETLTWILRRSPAAAASVSAVAQSLGADVPVNLTFVGQVGAADTGRPDVVGTDSANRERLLIEAKFGAQLTAHQPGAYLERLSTDAKSCLLVVAPAVRIASLWSELLRAVPELASNTPAPSSASAGTLTVTLTNSNVLALVSWRELVTAVLHTLRRVGEHGLVADAEQLLSLTEAMDAAAFDPAVPGDYSFRTARQFQQLEQLIDGAYNRALERKQLTRYSTRPSYGRIYYGWYLRAPKSQKSLWFGVLPRVWSRHGLSPLWAELFPSPSFDRQRLSVALGSFGQVGGVGLFDEGLGFVIPMTIKYFAGKADVIDDLVRQLEKIAGCLDADLAPGEMAVPDEPENALLDESAATGPPP